MKNINCTLKNYDLCFDEESQKTDFINEAKAHNIQVEINDEGDRMTCHGSIVDIIEHYDDLFNDDYGYCFGACIAFENDDKNDINAILKELGERYCDFNEGLKYNAWHKSAC